MTQNGRREKTALGIRLKEKLPAASYQLPAKALGPYRLEVQMDLAGSWQLW